jgi:hypothetical protein
MSPPSVVFLGLLLRILVAPSSDLVPETAIPDSKFSWFSKAPPFGYQRIATLASFQTLSNHPIIRHV